MRPRQHQADATADEYWDIERSLSRRTRPWHTALLLLCAAFVIAFGLGLCFSERENFSPEENRYLTTAPTVGLDALLDGSMTASLSDFCADQFPLRLRFITIKARFEQLLGKQQNNDVILGRENYLIARQSCTEQEREQLEQNLRAVRLFSEQMEQGDIPFTLAVVPRSIDVNTPYLPALYDTANADAAWTWLSDGCDQNGLSVLDLTEPLRTAAEQGLSVWYKTDHHWTALGAYYAYAALGESLGYEPYPLEDFTPVTVCEDFYGTTHASSGMYWIEGEALTLMRYEGDDRFVTEIVSADGTVTLQGLYDLSALDTHDEYNVFLGGTNTHIRVTDPTRTDIPTLVLLKDSFSQSLAPYLARHFQLVLIDPRTFKAAPSSSLYHELCQYEPDQVLLLCGIATLCEPSSLKNLAIGLDR